jgi:hypothetical protein
MIPTSPVSPAQQLDGRGRKENKVSCLACASLRMKMKVQMERCDLTRHGVLDTGSTIGATIANPDLITNLKVTSSPLQMATNADTKTLNLKGDVIGFGEAWYDPEFMANIFGFAKMADNNRTQTLRMPSLSTQRMVM